MCLQNISIFVSKIGLFGHYLEIASLDFADFAYYIRQEWYLTDLGGSSPQKKYLRLLWTIKTCLQIIFLSPNSISWLLLISFFCFAYFDRQQWFLAGTGGFSRQKIFWGPNWAHFWLVSKLLLSPNSLSWLLFTSFFFAYYENNGF